MMDMVVDKWGCIQQERHGMISVMEEVQVWKMWKSNRMIFARY